MEVEVHDTAGPYGVHLRSVQDWCIAECSWLHGIASILQFVSGRSRTAVWTAHLSKEHWYVIALKFLRSCLVSRLLERGVTTPRIDVVSPKIYAVVRVSTIQIVREWLADVRIISSSVAHTNWAIVLRLDVCLGISNRGFDEWCGESLVRLVDNLVACEEAQKVGVIGHDVHHACVSGEDVCVPHWIIRLNGLRWTRQICHDIDSRVREQSHALCMVLSRINGVDSDGISGELLEVGNVTPASGRICQRVDIVCGGGVASPWHEVLLVCYAFDKADSWSVVLVGGYSQSLTIEYRSRCRRIWSP